jgi:hypothetical protein
MSWPVVTLNHSTTTVPLKRRASGRRTSIRLLYGQPPSTTEAVASGFEIR